MRKALGLTVLLAALLAVTALWESSTGDGEIKSLTLQNIRNVLPLIGLYGFLSLGQALVIITGGIDLSVGSVVALVGIIATMGMRDAGLHPALVIPGALGVCVLIGAWHGLLVTKMRIQPFVVTLCGLFFYRGVARVISGDSSRGFGSEFGTLRQLGRGFIGDWLPIPFVLLLVAAAIIGAFLHFSASGRHLFALGANEEGARFSGIRTGRLKMLAYVLCSLLAGIGGLLFAFKLNTVSPNQSGNFDELYAIAGAVLGGCSLRGGTGNVLGVLLGVTLIRVLANLITILEIPSELEYVVIGGAILAGVCVDELLTRRAAAR